jgi:hypothetical protein
MLAKKKPKFVVITSDGSHLGFSVVNDVIGFNEGLALHYKPDDGPADVVFVGRDYRPQEYKGVYYVGKNIGNNSAAELIPVHRNGMEEKMPAAGPIVGKSADPNAPGEDYSGIGRSNLYALGLKAVYGKPSIPWNIIIIIAVVVIGLFIAIKTGNLHL